MNEIRDDFITFMRNGALSVVLVTALLPGGVSVVSAAGNASPSQAPGSAPVAELKKTPRTESHLRHKKNITELPLCMKIQQELNERSSTQAIPLSVASSPGEGRAIVYEGIDLDNDQLPDKVIQDCGSPSEGSCTLYVTPTSHPGYEFSERPFRVIHFEGTYYVVVGDEYPLRVRHPKRRVYGLTERGAFLKCKAI
jgi:hypothetical protein